MGYKIQHIILYLGKIITRSLINPMLFPNFDGTRLRLRQTKN